MSCDRRVDARLRLGLALLASGVTAVLQDPLALAWLLLAGALGCGVALACGETRPAALLRRLAAVNLFVLMIWLTLPFQLSPEGWRWSADGARLAAVISARTNAVALAVSALLAGLDGYAVARAAAGLGLPLRLARLMLLTVRYVELIGATWAQLQRAARSRGWQLLARRRSLAVLAQLLALLLVQALRRGERVEMAMRARGFSGAFGSAHRGEVPASHWGWAAGTLAALAGALLLPELPSHLWPDLLTGLTAAGAG